MAYCITPIYLEISKKFLATFPLPMVPLHIKLDIDLFADIVEWLETPHNIITPDKKSTFQKVPDLEGLYALYMVPQSLSTLKALYPEVNPQQVCSISGSDDFEYLSYGPNRLVRIKRESEVTVHTFVKVVFQNPKTKQNSEINLPLEGKDKYFTSSKSINLYLIQNSIHIPLHIPAYLLQTWQEQKLSAIRIVISNGQQEEVIEKKLCSFQDCPRSNNWLIDHIDLTDAKYMPWLRCQKIKVSVFLIKGDFQSEICRKNYTIINASQILLTQEKKYHFELLWQFPPVILGFPLGRLLESTAYVGGLFHYKKYWKRQISAKTPGIGFLEPDIEEGSSLMSWMQTTSEWVAIADFSNTVVNEGKNVELVQSAARNSILIKSGMEWFADLDQQLKSVLQASSAGKTVIKLTKGFTKRLPWISITLDGLDVFAKSNIPCKHPWLSPLVTFLKKIHQEKLHGTILYDHLFLSTVDQIYQAIRKNITQQEEHDLALGKLTIGLISLPIAPLLTGLAAIGFAAFSLSVSLYDNKLEDAKEKQRRNRQMLFFVVWLIEKLTQLVKYLYVFNPTPVVAGRYPPNSFGIDEKKLVEDLFGFFIKEDFISFQTELISPVHSKQKFYHIGSYDFLGITELRYVLKNITNKQKQSIVARCLHHRQVLIYKLLSLISIDRLLREPRDDYKQICSLFQVHKYKILECISKGEDNPLTIKLDGQTIFHIDCCIPLHPLFRIATEEFSIDLQEEKIVRFVTSPVPPPDKKLATDFLQPNIAHSMDRLISASGNLSRLTLEESVFQKYNWINNYYYDADDYRYNVLSSMIRGDYLAD